MNFPYGSLAHTAENHGTRLATSGLALETLANLLGHDGGEHHLSDSQVYGLACAVHAIGTAVRESGFELCDKAEQEIRK